MLSFAARIAYLKHPDGLYRGHVGIDRGTEGYRQNVGPTESEMEMVVRLQNAAIQAVALEFQEHFRQLGAPAVSTPAPAQEVA
jgi:hypothetical protein